MPLSDALMRAFSGYLSQHIGLWFAPMRWLDLERGMTRLAQARGFASPEDCMAQMMSTAPDRADVEMLAMYLSVGETYFFRDPTLFDVLEGEVLPALIKERRTAGKRQLKIWSAGCCTGEELYSLAIVLARLLPDLERWNLRLLGTDINPDFLAKATRGVYRDWSFRNLSPQIKQRYFTEIAGGGYAILPSLKRCVTFQYHNLASDAYPLLEGQTQDVDLILCRNVLMYFDTAQMRRAANNLHRSLVDDGWLVVSSAESGNEVFTQFQQIIFPDALLYRKTAEDSARKMAIDLRQPASRTANNSPRPQAGAFQAPRPHAAPLTPAAHIATAPTAPAFSEPIQLTTLATPPERTAALVPSETPYEIALRHYESGAYEQVAATLLPGDQASPDDLALLARAYANLGNLEVALHWAHTALAADKCNPAVRYLLALIHEERGEFDAAITSLKHAVYLDPEYALAHFSLGSAYQRQGKSQEARRHFNNATELLRTISPSQTLADSEGITAGHLIEIIQRKERAT